MDIEVNKLFELLIILNISVGCLFITIFIALYVIIVDRANHTESEFISFKEQLNKLIRDLDNIPKPSEMVTYKPSGMIDEKNSLKSYEAIISSYESRAYGNYISEKFEKEHVDKNSIASSSRTITVQICCLALIDILKKDIDEVKKAKDLDNISDNNLNAFFRIISKIEYLENRYFSNDEYRGLSEILRHGEDLYSNIDFNRQIETANLSAYSHMRTEESKKAIAQRAFSRAEEHKPRWEQYFSISINMISQSKHKFLKLIETFEKEKTLKNKIFPRNKSVSILNFFIFQFFIGIGLPFSFIYTLPVSSFSICLGYTLVLFNLTTYSFLIGRSYRKIRNDLF